MHIPTNYGRPLMLVATALDDNDTSLQIIIRRERVLERASALSSCPLLSIRKAQLVRSTPFGSRGHGCMRTIYEKA